MAAAVCSWSYHICHCWTLKKKKNKKQSRVHKWKRIVTKNKNKNKNQNEINCVRLEYVRGGHSLTQFIHKNFLQMRFVVGVGATGSASAKQYFDLKLFQRAAYRLFRHTWMAFIYGMGNSSGVCQNAFDGLRTHTHTLCDRICCQPNGVICAIPWNSLAKGEVNLELK